VKAAVVERPGCLVVAEVPEPPLGEYEARCQILCGATCSGTDLHLIEGRFPWPVQYPTVLGHESVGRVVEVGSKVRHYRVGDLVIRVGTTPSEGLRVNWGGFAQYGLARDHWAMCADGLPPEAWRSYRVNQVLPPDLDPRAATMIVTWRETLSYLTRMGVCPGASLLVVGSGGTGLSFAAHAALAGAGRVAVVGSPGRREGALAVGATDFFDYRGDRVDEELAGVFPEGFDLIVDSVGKTTSADRVLPLLKPGGMLGVYGIDEYGKCRLNPERARGSFTCYRGGYDEEEAHGRVVDRIRRRQLKAEFWLGLDKLFTLEGIGEAFEAVRRREVVKALVRIC